MKSARTFEGTQLSYVMKCCLNVDISTIFSLQTSCTIISDLRPEMTMQQRGGIVLFKRSSATARFNDSTRDGEELSTERSAGQDGTNMYKTVQM